MRKVIWLSTLLVTCMSLPALAADKSLTPQESQSMGKWWGDTNYTAGYPTVVGSECVFSCTPTGGNTGWGEHLMMVTYSGGPFQVGDVWKQRFTLAADSPYSVRVMLHAYTSDGTPESLQKTATLNAGESAIVELTITEAVKSHGYQFETGWWTGTDPIKVGETAPYVVKVGFPVDPRDPTRPSNPVPADDADLLPINLDLNGDTVIDGLSWTAPDSEPNMSIVGYKVYLDTVNPPVTEVTAQDADGNTTNTAWIPNAVLSYKTPYYWRVDTTVQYSYLNDPNLREGLVWSFTTIGAAPIVDAGSNVVTSLNLLPASIAGTITDANGDLQSAAWTLLTDDNLYPGLPAVKESMQMSLRTQTYPTDPNLLRDWIGTDNRSKGDPMKLTLSGLPAGTYTWTSYHHDTDNQTGLFDMTIKDADPVDELIANVDISAGATEPVRTVTATINSNGSPVTLIFDQQVKTPDIQAFFVMNGFELTNGTDSLKIDFCQSAASAPTVPTSPIQPGWQVYVAAHEAAATFTPQSYTAFGGTVTVNPDWGTPVTPAVAASVTPASPLNINAPAATFTTNTTGTYKVRLTGTDPDTSVNDYMEIRVYDTPCNAAKNNPAKAYVQQAYDFNNNCKVDLPDFALFASKWLEDKNLSGQLAFTSVVTYSVVTQP